MEKESYIYIPLQPNPKGVRNTNHALDLKHSINRKTGERTGHESGVVCESHVK